MKLQSINLNADRPDILRAKQLYGFWYGAVLGLGFSIFTWGIDAYTLSQYHGLHPWVMFVVGGVLCAGIGGMAGWASARLNKIIYSLAFWLTAALAFARLTVDVPLKLVPPILSIIEPATSGLLQYAYYPEFGTRIGVAYAWIAIFVVITGMLQTPLSESAVFSTSIMGKLSPLLISVILMSLCSFIVDSSLINRTFRSTIIAMDNTVQFVVDNQGKDIDPAESRTMHAGAFRTTRDMVTEERQLIVSGYDKYLGEIRVLIRFDTGWVECQVFYNQPGLCKAVEGME